MTISAMQPIWMGTQVKSTDAGIQEHNDAVSAMVDLASSETGDDAHLSAAGEMLAVDIEGPAMRWEKVTRLRQQIAAGTYRVSSLEIAGAMIDAMML